MATFSRLGVCRVDSEGVVWGFGLSEREVDDLGSIVSIIWYVVECFILKGSLIKVAESQIVTLTLFKGVPCDK